MTKLVKIRFHSRVVFEKFGPGNHPMNPVYTPDDVYEFAADVAQRWLKRGVAEVESEKPKVAKDVKAPAKAKPTPSKADSNDASDGDGSNNAGPRKTNTRSK